MRNTSLFITDEAPKKKFAAGNKNTFLQIAFTTAILFLLLPVSCSAPKEVKHLTSDVCLVIPKQTTKQEVLSFLGDPDKQEIAEDQSEKWTYFSVDKKLFQDKQFDVVVVTFKDNTAIACLYREMTEEEFNRNGLTESESTGE